MDTSVREALVLVLHEVHEPSTEAQAHIVRLQHIRHHPTREKVEAHFLEVHAHRAEEVEAHFLVATKSEVSHEMVEEVVAVSEDEANHLVAGVNRLHTTERHVVAAGVVVSKRHSTSQNL